MESDLRPALVGSALLHLLLLAAGVIAWPHLATSVPAAPVAVKLVASAPVADLRPAVEAPVPAPAAAPEPTPAPAPPVEAAPPPPPAPAPPTPAPPAPTPPPLDLDALATKLPKPKLDLNRLASKLPAAKPQPKLDLGALAQTAPKPGKAPKGPARPEQAVQAQLAVGAAQGLTSDVASILAAKLIRLWNPNCGAEGAANLEVRVEMRLSPSGALAAPPSLVGAQSNDPIWEAAAQRALNAVARGAPYDDLPRDRYAIWKDVVFKFDGRRACGGG